VLNNVKGMETMKENVNLVNGGTHFETDISKKLLLLGTCL
jgi:hypothetical protein